LAHGKPLKSKSFLLLFFKKEALSFLKKRNKRLLLV
jgi:hypothetical protein